jgi:hypothetical protein
MKLLPIEDEHPPKYQLRNSNEDFDKKANEG